MSSVLARAELERSPLADLHLIANELGVDGFRRLRKADLVDAILAVQDDERPQSAADGGPDALAPEVDEPAADQEPPSLADPVVDAEEAGDVIATAEQPTGVEDAQEEAETRGRGRRGRRGGRSRLRMARGAEVRDEDEAPEAREAETEPVEESAGEGEPVVEGVVELLANGSGFLRLSPPEATDQDVYVSAAQVKRCELVSGDRVSGPVRAPRRSERHPSLVRVDTINGLPADEVVEGTRFEDLPVAFPSERLALDVDDPTVKAIEWLTPFGKGSRVLLTGPSRAGKSEALRRIAAALAGQEGLEVTVVLAGVRPEEVADWPDPVAALSFAASADAQAQAVEQAVEQGRRVAARGGDAVVVVDTLDYLPPPAARRALAAARNLVDGGSLTLIATGSEPLGGETTVVALDPGLTALRRFPALDLAASGTLRPELLVGEAGADAVARARAEAQGA
jgi:transcription termination factor Rho